MKVKVIEIVGTPLKKNCAYIFAIPIGELTGDDIDFFQAEIQRILGHDKFTIVITESEPEEFMHVYQIPNSTPIRKTVG